jgi:Tfp pilus assembly protein PilO
LALLAAAAGVAVWAWLQHRSESELPGSAPVSTLTEAVVAPVVAPVVRSLPQAAEIPALLTRVERAAVSAGLGWARADYRVNGATDDTPASLEVRCTLKGAYPNMRRFVTTLLQETPALTLKEFSLMRPNAETADVEAKLTVLVYLSGDVRAPR